ncbi:MAG: divergent polysaccharide deacetylase family protein [Alphaproteobacteria bacterium]
MANTPTTNLLPAIVAVAIAAVLSLALALYLPVLRRAEAPSIPVEHPQPLPPLTTEFPETTEPPAPVVVPEPVGAPSPTEQTVSNTVPEPLAISPTVLRYQTNAQPVPTVPQGHATLALVIDDMGVDVPATEDTMALLPAPVTFAFLPYGTYSAHQARAAYANGHEILVHIPMEPLATSANGQTPPNPGPHALRVDDSPEVWNTNLAVNLKPFLDVAIGANNHMGSRFTQSTQGMAVVLAHLANHGLLFLDSYTTARTATRAAGAGMNIPLLQRNVFLDDNISPAAIEAEFNHAIAYARKHGHAIAIGHPHPATLAVLARRLPTLEQEGIALVPLTYDISKF